MTYYEIGGEVRQSILLLKLNARRLNHTLCLDLNISYNYHKKWQVDPILRYIGATQNKTFILNCQIDNSMLSTSTGTVHSK